MGEQEGKGGALDLVLGVFVLALLLAVTWFYVFAIPKYGEQFEDWGVELPHLTVVLLNASLWVRVNWLFLAIISVAVVTPATALLRGSARTVFLLVLVLLLVLMLIAALAGVYLPAQRLRAITTPAPGAGP